MDSSAEIMRVLFRRYLDEGNYVLAVIVGERLLSAQKTDCANDKFALAWAYAEIGLYDKAEEHYADALRNASAHCETEFVYDLKNNYGVCLARNDKPDEAVKLFREVYKYRAKRFGAEHAETVSVIYNLGNALFDMGRYKDAVNWHKKALPYRVGVDLADSYNSIGYCYEKTEDEGEAVEWFTRALALLKNGEREDYLSNVLYLADVCLSRGDTDGGVAYYDEAVALGKELFGKDSATYAKLLNRAADVMLFVGEVDESVKTRVRSLELLKTHIGQNHMYYVDGYRMVASLCRMSGKHDKAEAFMRKSMRVREGLTNVISDAYIIDAAELTSWYVEDGETDKIKKMCGKMLKLIETKLIDGDEDKYSDICDGFYDVLNGRDDEARGAAISELKTAVGKLTTEI